MALDTGILAMLYVATLLQVVAAVVALLLIPLSGMRRSWILMAVALTIQAFRRVYLAFQPSTPTLTEAVTALAVSVLLVLGILGIRRVFQALERAERVLGEEASRRRRFVNVANAMVVSLDVEGRVVSVDERVCELVGCRAEEIVGLDWFTAFVPERLRHSVREDYTRMLASDKTDDEYVEHPIGDLKGEEHDIVWHRRIIRDESGSVVGVRTAGIDVSAKTSIESEVRFRSMLLDRVTDAVIVHDLDGRVLYLNDAACRLTGRTIEGAIGKQVREVLGVGHSKHEFEWYSDAVRSEGSIVLESEITRKNGPPTPVELHAQLAHDAGRRVVVCVARDVTDRRRAEQTIRRMAFYDALTGLPNRTLLADRSEVAFAQADRHGEQAAVLFIDIDQLKDVNDSYGHRCADGVLVHFAQRLKESVRSGDTVARVGGDEFAILLPATGRSAAERVTRKVLKAVQGSYEPAPACRVEVSASIGASMYPEDGGALDTLIERADLAMFLAKRNGGGCACFFAEDAEALELD